ncbi:uncharacterized protein METZ01_LOCUS269030, partial [marine metagenome]
ICSTTSTTATSRSITATPHRRSTRWPAPGTTAPTRPRRRCATAAGPTRH